MRELSEETLRRMLVKRERGSAGQTHTRAMKPMWLDHSEKKVSQSSSQAWDFRTHALSLTENKKSETLCGKYD